MLHEHRSITQVGSPGAEFRNDDFVASGSQVLRCSYGVWVDAGSTIDDRSP